MVLVAALSDIRDTTASSKRFSCPPTPPRPCRRSPSSRTWAGRPRLSSSRHTSSNTASISVVIVFFFARKKTVKLTLVKDFIMTGLEAEGTKYQVVRYVIEGAHLK